MKKHAGAAALTGFISADVTAPGALAIAAAHRGLPPRLLGVANQQGKEEGNPKTKKQCLMCRSVEGQLQRLESPTTLM